MASKVIAGESRVSSAEAAQELTVMIKREEDQEGWKPFSIGGGVDLGEGKSGHRIFVVYALLVK